MWEDDMHNDRAHCVRTDSVAAFGRTLQDVQACSASHRLHVCICMCFDTRTVPKCACVCLPQVCDVSSLASVSAFAKEWCAAARPLHLLVNNAGVLVRGSAPHLAASQAAA